MRADKTLLALLMCSTVALLAGCNPDRFNDPGCSSDEQCRGERICLQGRCIDPDQADNFDTGSDTGADGATDTVETIDISEDELERFQGNWRADMTVEFCRQSGMGAGCQSDNPQDVALEVTPTRGADLSFIFEALGGCAFTANVTRPGVAEFREDSCSIDAGPGQSFDVTVVGDSAEITGEGQMSFLIELEGTIGDEDFEEEVTMTLDGDATRTER